jgi:hypothetical protein
VTGFEGPHSASSLLYLGERPETNHFPGGRRTINLPVSPTVTFTEPILCCLVNDTVPSMGNGVISSPATNVNVPETVPKVGGLVVVGGEVTPHAASAADPRAIARSMLSIRFMMAPRWQYVMSRCHLLSGPGGVVMSSESNSANLARIVHEDMRRLTVAAWHFGGIFRLRDELGDGESALWRESPGR